MNEHEGAIEYTEVEVTAEHGDDFVAALAGHYPDGVVPDFVRTYRHVFTGAQPMLTEVAATIGVPPDAAPETAALMFATRPGFTASMKPGTVRLRRHTVTVTPWETLPLVHPETTS